jgi:prophage regulatory protein
MHINTSASELERSTDMMFKGIRFLRLPEVKQVTGLSRSSIYKRIQEGRFPTPVRIGGTAVGWVESEIAEWAADLVAKARGIKPDH